MTTESSKTWPPVLQRLSTMSAKARRDLSVRAHKELLNEEKVAEARAIVSGIAAYESKIFNGRLMRIGLVDWQPFEYQHFMRGFHDGQEVANIEYLETHKASRKDVFKLTVLDRTNEQLIHHVPDARRIGSDIYTGLAAMLRQ